MASRVNKIDKVNILWGFVLLFFVGFVFLMATFFEHKAEVNKALAQCVKKTKEEFDGTLPEQPMIYTENIKIAPGNCQPYSGCFFPSSLANPVNPKTGKRAKPPGADDIWCEKSWRDCNAYQECVNGKCVPNQ